jgi:hypothetical protein
MSRVARAKQAESAAALVPIGLEALAVLVLRHLLAPLLDQRAHHHLDNDYQQELAGGKATRSAIRTGLTPRQGSLAATTG